MEDYDLGESIGKGSFGSVHKVTCRETKNHFAMKIIEKVSVHCASPV